MMSIVKCDGCGKSLGGPMGMFRYGASAVRSAWCSTCRQTHDGEGTRQWWFCSVACLLKLKPCGSCGGVGTDREVCLICEGCGLEVLR